MSVNTDTLPPAFPTTEPDTAPEPAAAPTEVDVILASPGSLTVAGVPAVVQRLRMRELLTLVRAVTNGIGTDFRKFNLDPEADDFGSQVAGLLVVALPNALEDFVDLFGSIVAARDTSNTEHANQVREEMRNPDIGDAIDILSVMIEQERHDLPALLGKAKVVFGGLMALTRTGKAGT